MKKKSQPLETSKLEEIELHKDLADKYYLVREKNPHYIYFNNYWIAEYRDLLPKQKYEKALDLGCGTVEFYELIKDDLKASYRGIDLSPDMLEMGKKKYKGINVSQADAENLPFDDEAFDVIVGRGIIHHLPNPGKGAEEAFRVLKKGGYFVVSEPHSNMILYYIRRAYYKFSAHFSDVHKSFYREEFIDLIEKAGFEVEKVRYWGLLSFPFAFPDILPIYKFMPLPLFKMLVQIDRVLTKIPLINSFSWHIILLCKKRVTKKAK